MDAFPKVSIVIVNMNGKHHLRECFDSILKLHYPKEKIEVVLVDNGSTDGSVEFVTQKYRWVKLIRNAHNEGFAKPSNDGAKAATGEYVAFINNDMRVQKDWLIELINSMRKDGAKCAGSVILNWNGKLLDFAGGGVDFQGLGFQSDYQRPMSEMEPLLTADKELLFACGGAMIIEREFFLFAGGFDEDYFAYYEDVDLGWRLRVLGCKIVLSVKSRVYHKHNSTSKTITKERVQYLFERNKLYTCYKNYGEELFYKVFFPSLLLEIRETYLESGIDGYNYNIKNSGAFDSEPVKIGSRSALKLSALNEFVENLQKTDKKRVFIQSNRKASDENVMRFMSDPFMVFPKDTAEMLSTEFEVVKTFGIDKLLNSGYKCKVLIISKDNVGQKMAGNGTRYLEIAKALAAAGGFNVTLACPDSCDLCHEGINILTYTPGEAGGLLQAAKEAVIVMSTGFVLDAIPELKRIVNKKYVIIDIIDPFVIESLEVNNNGERTFKNTRHKEAAASLDCQLKLGDFFACANEKQKDYLLGMLSKIDRVNPQLYEADQSCNKLIDTVPFGIPDIPPVHTRNVLKGVLPGIGKDDKVLIWDGGVWNRSDPLTLIRAVKAISGKRSDVKLFFMDVKQPDAAAAQIKTLDKAVDLAHELDVYDKYVFFSSDSIDYDDRQNYLLEADIGVSNHFDTLETRYSFKTCMLDYLWADLPIVCTKGDCFSRLVSGEKLGAAVPFNDEQALAQSLADLLDNNEKFKECRENVARVAQNYKWSKVTKPIVDFCEEPMRFSSRDVPEDEQDGSSEAFAAADSERVNRRGSVQEKLALIERQQQELEKLIRSDSRRIKETHGSVKELQDWSYLMDSRFAKLKRALGRFKFLRRFMK